MVSIDILCLAEDDVRKIKMEKKEWKYFVRSVWFGSVHGSVCRFYELKGGMANNNNKMLKG